MKREREGYISAVKRTCGTYGNISCASMIPLRSGSCLLGSVEPEEEEENHYHEPITFAYIIPYSTEFAAI